MTFQAYCFFSVMMILFLTFYDFSVCEDFSSANEAKVLRTVASFFFVCKKSLEI